MQTPTAKPDKRFVARTGSGDSVPEKSAAEFWKEFDAKKAGAPK